MTGLPSEAGGTAGGGGLDKDLATLSFVLADYRSDRGQMALGRVEAELSRLREQRDEAERRASVHEIERGKNAEWAGRMGERAAAAEARCAHLQDANDRLLFEKARLQQALGAYRSALRSGEPESERLLALGDEAIAGQPAAAEGPGSEQSSLTESGSAGLPDTPADSPVPHPICTENEACGCDWHYWRCPKHHDYGLLADSQEDKT